MLSLTCAIGYCLALTGGYIAGLYVWGIDLDRDSSQVIVKRSLSTFVLAGFALLCVYHESDGDFMTTVGFLPVRSTASATLKGLTLTTMLFAGPLLQPTILETRPGYIQMTIDLIQWHLSSSREWTDCEWIFLRNLVISPVTEELVFRASFISLLMKPASSGSHSVILASLIFSFAHLHSLVEFVWIDDGREDVNCPDVVDRQNDRFQIVLDSLFQVAYTFLFGLFSGFLFISSRSVVSCICVHALCNFIGPPAVSDFFLPPPHFLMSRATWRLKRILAASVYCFGLAAFLYSAPRVF